MATYKEIKGVTIQTKDSDPVVGGVAGGSWSSGGNLNEGRTRSAASGTQTATIFGGGTPPTTADVESYNGSSWTEIAEMNTARAELMSTGAAPYTATIFFSGHTGTYPTQTISTANEYWNGSSWTEVAEVNAGRRSGGGAGTAYTAGLFFGGYTGSTLVTSTESWNGSSWTEVNDMNTARYFLGGAGSSTSAIAVNGEASPGQTNKTEEWDGSSWTEVANSPTSTNYVNATGSANSDVLSMFGPSTGTGTFHWDGASWTEVAEYATGRGGGTATGSSSAALLSGGNPAPVNASTEEWATAPVTSAILTEGSVFLSGGTTLKGFGKAAGIPATTWASGPSMNTARSNGGGWGEQTSGAVAAGVTPSRTAATEEFDGSSWTEVNDLNSARAYVGAAGANAEAGLLFGGSSPAISPTSGLGLTESWDGSTWTEVNDLNSNRREIGGTGQVYTAVLAVGGQGVSPTTTYRAFTESWDGTNWTEVGDLNSSGSEIACSGSATSAIAAGGESPGGPRQNKTESWDGTSWTEIAELNTSRQGCGATGSDNKSSLVFGGYPVTAKTEFWNGSSWTELNDLATGRQAIGDSSIGAVAAFAGGGNTPPYTADTELWTADSALADISFD
tara:strand:- start:45 stop:1898 length:1854 start_codon:yes stop_codon:yes gene_type:complete